MPVAWAEQCGQARHGLQADHELESARPVNRDIAGFGSVETLVTGPAGVTIAIWCCFAAFCACTRTAPAPVPSNRTIGRENYREPTLDASRPLWAAWRLPDCARSYTNQQPARITNQRRRASGSPARIDPLHISHSHDDSELPLWLNDGVLASFPPADGRPALGRKVPYP